MKKQVEELKAVVRREAFINVAVSGNSSHQLKLIDAIQRLGVAYHFEKEIDEALEKYYHHGDHDGDLDSVALRFRLLRQHGYDVSCGRLLSTVCEEIKLLFQILLIYMVLIFPDNYL